ncbi:MAG: hypothetical protein K0S45_4615, partial [Nitrospira sp.]|nr:hypothetical protein [Nitrospira sp.]
MRFYFFSCRGLLLAYESAAEVGCPLSVSFGLRVGFRDL